MSKDVISSTRVKGHWTPMAYEYEEDDTPSTELRARLNEWDDEVIEFYKQTRFGGWMLAFSCHAYMLNEDQRNAIIEGQYDVELRLR